MGTLGAGKLPPLGEFPAIPPEPAIAGQRMEGPVLEVGEPCGLPVGEGDAAEDLLELLQEFPFVPAESPKTGPHGLLPPIRWSAVGDHDLA